MPPSEELENSKPDTTSMWLHRDTAKQLKTVADHHGLTMAEALDRFAGAAILKAYKRALEEMTQAITIGGEG